jgi:DNA-binding ferritin-like protein
MSTKALEKIEKAVAKLAEQQGAICAQVAQLSERIESLGASGNGSVSKAKLIEFLDQFRAGEALGEASLGAWIAVSDTACLRGGLRTVQQREGMHARLLEARLKELGASPNFEIPEDVYDQAMERSGSTDRSDAEKLLEFVKNFPDPEAAVKPIHDMADKLDHDQETQSLLRTIAQDERSTLEFLNEACALLNS